MEEWRAIPIYGGLYEVSNYGRIRSISHPARCVSKNGNEYHRITKGRVLRLHQSGSGYLKAVLSKGGKEKNYTVHQLVAFSFLDTRRISQEIHHKDHNKLNNRADNLEFVSIKENRLYDYRDGARPKGKEHHFSSLPRNSRGNCKNKKQVEAIYPIKIEEV